MLQTLNPYPSSAKTAEIMARYRPIAPKPDFPNITCISNICPHLQPKSKKRGRPSTKPPPPPPTPTKRSKTPTPPPNKLSLNPFLHSPNTFTSLPDLNSVTTQSTLVTLPLLPGSREFNGGEQKILDFNKSPPLPQEKDFLHLLQGLQGVSSTRANSVIAPQPIRPVGSSIYIRSIKGDSAPGVQLLKKPEEVEKEMEAENLPVVVTDSNNKVRMVNSAYKEMVGQPECMWLDAMLTSGGPSKRICGEVNFQFPESGLPISANGFSCWARIEWGSNGKKKSVDTACKVMRLYCDSKDYLLIWRFHTIEVFDSGSE